MKHSLLLYQTIQGPIKPGKDESQTSKSITCTCRTLKHFWQQKIVSSSWENCGDLVNDQTSITAALVKWLVWQELYSHKQIIRIYGKWFLCPVFMFQSKKLFFVWQRVEWWTWLEFDQIIDYDYLQPSDQVLSVYLTFTTLHSTLTLTDLHSVEENWGFFL